MMWGPDPGVLRAHTRPPQAAAARQAEASRQSAAEKQAAGAQAADANEKVGLLGVVLLYPFTCFEETAGSRGGWYLEVQGCRVMVHGAGLQGFSMDSLDYTERQRIDSDKLCPDARSSHVLHRGCSSQSQSGAREADWSSRVLVGLLLLSLR